ncbi:hypothetical protein D9758_004973 [Tetrapyrgos nigripes]|uniref:Uncharacterized protein n=1 Tax=Tetrapyrgos nigripes TaxID=182062 RepID=A0A8H5GVP6_9AGAR|nr:hypothetical protein D9758_004973 [Tetrapyrgos nigripes]
MAIDTIQCLIARSDSNPPYKSIQFRGSPSGQIVQKTFTYSLDDLASNEVIIKVTDSGLCFTDIHMLKKDMCLGHEGVGIVQAIGSDCKNVKVGCCEKCKFCLGQDNHYCKGVEWYGSHNTDSGSLSTFTKRKEAWLFKIPASMPDTDAAPLMCGGASVWSPIIQNCHPFDRVGIIRIRGLGHLAIQTLRKMGCDIVVFSTDELKCEEALSLGANEFHSVRGLKKDYGELGIEPVDMMFISTSAKIPMGQLYPVMNPRSTIVLLTVDEGDLTLPYTQLVETGMTILGSSIAPRLEQILLLKITENARNEVHVMAETFPLTLEDVNEAVEKLKSGKMRYCGVLVPKI